MSFVLSYGEGFSKFQSPGDGSARQELAAKRIQMPFSYMFIPSDFPKKWNRSHIYPPTNVLVSLLDYVYAL